MIVTNESLLMFEGKVIEDSDGQSYDILKTAYVTFVGRRRGLWRVALFFETLSRRLKILEEEGVIELGKGREITILDCDSLEMRTHQ